MRPLLGMAAALALLVAACNDDNHRLDSLEAQRADVTSMQKQVAMLQAQLAALQPVDVQPIKDELVALKAQVAALPPPFDPKPLTDRLDALEAKVNMGGGAVKVPHLVVAMTGEDLGQLVAGPDVIWSTKLKGELAVATLQPLSFDKQTCQGNTAFRGARQGMYGNTATGRIYKVSGPLSQFQSQSFIDNNGKCHDAFEAFDGVPAVDTGIVNTIFPIEQLRLDVR